MTLEPDLTTLRRLVWLQIGCLLLALARSAYEGLDPGWSGFDTAFATLRARTFGTPSVGYQLGLAAGLMLSVGYVAALIGLLRVRRWARPAYLASSVGLVIGYAVMDHPVGYASWFIALIDSVDQTAFGATIVLVYADRWGGRWFSPAQG